jgi:cytochrome P450 family 135
VSRVEREPIRGVPGAASQDVRWKQVAAELSENDIRLPPGPRLPRLVQTLWLGWRPVSLQQRCQRRFGDCFTLRFVGQLGTTVYIADPAAVKAVFTGDPKVFRAGQATFRVGSQANNAVLEPLLGQHSVALQDGQPHLRRRRLMLPLFHGERIQRQTETIREIARRELERWPKHQPFPLGPRLQAITLEVMMRAVFGIEGVARLRELELLVSRPTKIIVGSRAAMLPFSGRFPGRTRWGPWARLQRAIDSLDEVLFEEIRRRRHDPGTANRDDVLSMLLQARDEDGDGMTDAELRDQLVTLLLAGHETTATSASAAVELLLRHPEALNKLDQDLTSGGTAYLDAVIKETLRLRPTIVTVGRRLTAPVTMNGYRLPAGINVSPAIQLLHRRPDIYPTPEAFRPERFLEQPPDAYQWIPFGGGTHRCIGASLAMLELRIIVSTILRHARLSLVERRFRSALVVLT